ncbi:MAG: hypothetical protein AAB538_05665 [Patescibacteria group bacterium]
MPLFFAVMLFAPPCTASIRGPEVRDIHCAEGKSVISFWRNDSVRAEKELAAGARVFKIGWQVQWKKVDLGVNVWEYFERFPGVSIVELSRVAETQKFKLKEQAVEIR